MNDIEIHKQVQKIIDKLHKSRDYIIKLQAILNTIGNSSIKMSDGWVICLKSIEDSNIDRSIKHDIKDLLDGKIKF